MVLYFSGTGNSKYVAQRIAEILGDELLSINDRLKAGDTSVVQVGEKLILVTPTYAWRIPRVVRDWIEKTEFAGAEKVWFVMTCGGEIGNAAQYNRALCAAKSFTYMNTTQIVMPENYIAMFSAPDTAKAREIVQRAEPSIDRAVACIGEGRELPLPRKNLYGCFMSGPVNPVFYAFCVKAKAFTVSDKCIGCGKCTTLCPMNNITIQDGKPVWGGNCTHCMSCICYCPAEAIEYGQKSLGQPRYKIEAVLAEEADHA